MPIELDVPESDVDDSDAHATFCQCDTCVEALIGELEEDRAA